MIQDMDNLTVGLTLMVIGMITVFCILLLVINVSKLLIVIVNKIAPEEQAPAKAEPKAAAVDAVTMDVIRATVAQLTGGKGTVTSVERF